MGRLADLTTKLSNSYCGGSSRKLIASWWYAILFLSGLLLIMSLLVTSTRVFSEGFAALWSGIMLLFLSIGGTMIMRKFHNSFAVGFFMGSVVAMSQLFLLLFLVYCGYAKDRSLEGGGFQEEFVMSILCLVQCLLLGSFAAILGAHRSDMIEKSPSSSPRGDESTEGGHYDPPRPTK